MSVTVDRSAAGVSREVRIGASQPHLQHRTAAPHPAVTITRSRPTFLSPRPRFAAPVAAPAPVQPRVAQTAADDTFEALANPARRLPSQRAPVDWEDGSEGPDDEETDDGESMGPTGDTSEDEEGMMADMRPIEQIEMPPQLTPAQGYATLDEEKYALLFKLDRLKKTGRIVPNLTVHSDLVEIRAAAAQLEKSVGIEQSVKFQKTVLKQLFYGAEWVSSNVSALDLELDGWGESQNSSLDTGNYDGVLEELAEKYSRGGRSMPPEFKLLYMILSSAAIHSFTRKLSRTAGIAAAPAGTLGGSGFGSIAPQDPGPPPNVQARPEIAPPPPAFGGTSIFGGGMPTSAPTPDPLARLLPAVPPPGQVPPAFPIAPVSTRDTSRQVLSTTQTQDDAGSVAATEDFPASTDTDTDSDFDVPAAVSGKRKRNTTSDSDGARKVVIV